MEGCHGCYVVMVTGQKSHFHEIYSLKAISFLSEGIERQVIHHKVG